MFEMFTIKADFCHKWKPVYLTNLYNYSGENLKKYTFAEKEALLSPLM